MDPVSNIPPIATAPLPAPAGPELSYATPSEYALPTHWTNVETFTLDPARRDRFLLLFAGLSILITLLMLGAVLLTQYLMVSALDPAKILTLIITITVIQFISTTRLILRFRRGWTTARTTIADQGLLNESPLSKRNRIDAADITRITETFDAFKVFTRRHTHLSLSKRVPSDDLPHLRQRLAALHPISPSRGLLGIIANLALNWGLALAAVVLFYIGLLSSDATLVLFLAAATLLLTAIRIIRVFLNKNSSLTLRFLVFVELLFPFFLAIRFLLLEFLLR